MKSLSYKSIIQLSNSHWHFESVRIRDVLVAVKTFTFQLLWISEVKQLYWNHTKYWLSSAEARRFETTHKCSASTSLETICPLGEPLFPVYKEIYCGTKMSECCLSQFVFVAASQKCHMKHKNVNFVMLPICCFVRQNNHSIDCFSAFTKIHQAGRIMTSFP